MIWPFHNKELANYWLKVFALYALVEACIQLLFYFVLNNFGKDRISIIEFHLVMWFFQCMLIWPIWWVAWSVRKKNLVTQILANTVFYIVYTICWFLPVQDAIFYIYNNLQGLTRSPENQQVPYLDRGYEFSYLNYQLLKHTFRLSWFFLAAFFYSYRSEEKKRLELAVANRELQLRLLKWHLNPSFYFKTISHFREVAAKKPINTTGPILQLAKVMEYVIYEAKEKLINVKKEINFLSNYIQLINQQPVNNAKFEMEVHGEHDKLKIAPLLLAGFIDKIIDGNNAGEQRNYTLHLRFSGQQMEMGINQDPEKQVAISMLNDEALHQRLTELYPERFTLSDSMGNGQFKLSLMLDDE
jgi:sensor histidine kinase YesM